jgi:hypothetical protein
MHSSPSGCAGSIVAAAHYGLPSIGSGQQFPRDGGLMTYQEDPLELAVQGASYIDRILRGAKPADLPVQQPTKYSLVINLKTAKARARPAPGRRRSRPNTRFGWLAHEDTMPRHFFDHGAGAARQGRGQEPCYRMPVW